MRMTPTRIAALLIGALVSTAATKSPTSSWGKPGISFAQYQADATTCGRQGYYRDIADTEQAKAFVAGSAMIQGVIDTRGNDPDAARSYAMAREGVQPERRMKELRVLLQSTVDQCLVSRGYTRFALTDAQRKAVGRLAIGTDARRRYLYDLAADPAVLARQAQQ